MTTSAKLSQVRIIGGHFKRRNISFIHADGLRPTPDRLRETVFNWLMADMFGAKVLDACAGSGVLGFEALSRGADHTTFIEPNTAQASKIKQNADTLKLTKHQFTIIGDVAERAIPLLGTPFDVVFIDPPYALNLWHTIIDAITSHKLCHADTQFYIEADKPLDEILQPFCATLIKSTKVGQIYAGIFTLN